MDLLEMVHALVKTAGRARTVKLVHQISLENRATNAQGAEMELVLTELMEMDHVAVTQVGTGMVNHVIHVLMIFLVLLVKHVIVKMEPAMMGHKVMAHAVLAILAG